MLNISDSVIITELDMSVHKPGQKPEQALCKAHEEKSLPRDPSQWRPSFHVTAPAGWLNDPCGLGYDPTTGLYHLCFQWNPHGNDWGNISWGHATSPDLVSWTTSTTPILTPSAKYDRRGVFTGCLQATDASGHPGALTILYTSVSHLPIHHTLPYTLGSESLSLAVSQDGGKTWERQDCNPVLTGPPPHFNVTAWRDPFITTWAEGPLSKHTPSTLYGFMSGGIAKKTPTIFVYTVQATDLGKWDFIGPLVDIGLNLQPSRWSGDYGVNWEVANLMTLTNDTGTSRDFIIMGAEGCVPLDSSNPTQNGDQEARRKREARAQLWMSITSNGDKNSTSTDISLASYAFSGIFDHGCYYAANSFYDPQTSQHIVCGWITEEDLSDSLRHRQGFSGLISLPRVVGLMTLKKVKNARSSQLSSITSIDVVPDAPGTGTFTIHTMKISPDSRLTRLRQSTRESHIAGVTLSTSPSQSAMMLGTSKWEIDAEFSISKACARVGIKILHTSDAQNCTTISWDPRSETFEIHRPLIDNADVNDGYETAPHTLFTFLGEHGEEIEETLRVHAFFDSSVLEVFVNDRTVISTRIYHPADHCFGALFFAESDAGVDDGQPAAVLVRASIWDGLGVRELANPPPRL
ncbi:Glycoside hydrolase family 32 [Penicillium robsamsonii]|uniref:Glycoside hydrolase family 32 n=1 Tax=Penicillium robsamsonii TaxID=1792511 RepID=UPI002548AABA|nr:Glycoside hydrolase family 32 [Penicillium robsamsonii]KAJ5822872.1 Glycoside hydrolase family 32 [Penicillium robsamsonii]